MLVRDLLLHPFVVFLFCNVGISVPMKKSILITALFVLLFSQSLLAQGVDAIMKQVEDNLNGRNAVMKITMEIRTSRVSRSMKMLSYSKGQEKSFIKILYPRKDAGITFLKVDNSMWQYVPRIEKVIKIPASMMLQSWMGSDFSNDDLVKESSLYEDYTHQLMEETENSYHIELKPMVDAAVVWSSIRMSVSKDRYLPQKISYFDEDGALVRELVYTDVKRFGTRWYPGLWIMTPCSQEKRGHETRITVEDVVFDGEIDEAYFSKRALKRFSH